MTDKDRARLIEKYNYYRQHDLAALRDWQATLTAAERRVVAAYAVSLLVQKGVRAARDFANTIARGLGARQADRVMVTTKRGAELPPALLVISFGVPGSPSHRSLDRLLADAGCGADEAWCHLAVPLHGRSRLLDGIDAAILQMSDKDGRILPDDAFADAVGLLFEEDNDA